MGARDASRVQLDFPQLVADIIRQLNLTGTVGVLEFSDLVTPVYIVAQREGALQVTLAPPVFTSAEIFSGEITAPAINTIIFDSGAQAAGDYDLFASISQISSSAVEGSVLLEHRNAANAATLAVLLSMPAILAVTAGEIALPLLRYTLALNERIRLRVTQTMTGRFGGVLGLHRVPTP